MLKFGNSEFLHCGSFRQLIFFINVFDMFIYGGFGFSEKQSHLLLCKPNGFLFAHTTEILSENLFPFYLFHTLIYCKFAGSYS